MVDRIIVNMHPRTRPTLGNLARMMIHPTGVRDFTVGVRDDLNLEGTRTGKFLVDSGTFYDGAKYFMGGLLLGSIAYHNIIEGVLQKI